MTTYVQGATFNLHKIYKIQQVCMWQAAFKIIYRSAPSLFCFVLLPCTSFFQNGPGTNIVGRLSKLSENYTQYHHVELQRERAKVHKVRFTQQILGSREVQVDKDSVEKETQRLYGLQNGLHVCISQLNRRRKYITVAIRRDGITNVQTIWSVGQQE